MPALANLGANGCPDFTPAPGVITAICPLKSERSTPVRPVSAQLRSPKGTLSDLRKPACGLQSIARKRTSLVARRQNKDSEEFNRDDFGDCIDIPRNREFTFRAALSLKGSKLF
jgi:hypothetical protein